MKHFYCLLLALPFFLNSLFAQSCLPDGIEFTTQQEIDNFAANYPGCTEILGTVLIDGDYSYDITSLAGLNQITSIEGGLGIFTTSALVDLTGLNNLTHIGIGLDIGYNTALTKLSGLENLSSLEGFLWLDNNYALTNLEALAGLTTVGGDVKIDNCDALTNLAGLQNISSIEGKLTFAFNDSLTTMNGLEALTSVGGKLTFYLNGGLTSLSGLDNIDHLTITDLSISNNSNLSVCDVESICNYLMIIGAPSNIFGNAVGCNSKAEVEGACLVPIGNAELGHLGFSISPVPAKDKIWLRSEVKSGAVDVIITDLTGTKIYQWETEISPDNATIIDISKYPVGVYFLTVNDGRIIQTQRFTRQ